MSDQTLGKWLALHQVVGRDTEEERFLFQPRELPPDFTGQVFEPTPEDRKAAWELHTEIRTRISTQPLHYRSGDEETALKSLYELFGVTRDILKEHGPECRRFATLAVFVLNRHIRPFTAKWHKKTVDKRLPHDDARRNFRAELERLQGPLRLFSTLLGSLAEGDFFVAGSESGSVAPGQGPEYTEPGLGAAIPFDSILGLAGSDILARERDSIRARRKAAQRKAARPNEEPADEEPADEEPADAEPPTDLTGLAVSGGGIRSATFFQGIAQRLCEENLLPAIDYLSTVSGGGYFGSFLSSYWNTADVDIGPGRKQLPFFERDEPEPKPLRHLRNQSKYFLKGGLPGKSRALGLLLYGVLINILALGLLVLSVVVSLRSLRAFGLETSAWTPSGAQVLGSFAALLALLAIGLPLVYRWSKNREFVKGWEFATLGALLTTALLGALLAGGPTIWSAYLHLTGQLSPGLALGIATLLPLLLVGPMFAPGAHHWLGRLFINVVAITGPFILLVVCGSLVDAGLDARLAAVPDQYLLPALFLLAAVVNLVLVDVNLVSLHRYYRNRLAETYLVRRGENNRAVEVDPQPLSELGKHGPAAPYHLLNAAVNLPASKLEGLRGRNADFFLFSRHYCGSPVLGYCETETLETCDPRMNLGTAMAISGAAAAPYMGPMPFAGFWQALLNLRLSYWLPNPGEVDAARWPWFGPNSFHLLRELFGRLHEKGRYVSVSDGAHIENLGIYELLRRRCKYIIALDAEADPGMRFEGLIKVIRYAEIDLKVHIWIDLGDFEKDDSGYSKAHFSLGRIEYPGGEIGLLLYIKSSLTGNEREYIQDYRKRHPSFPHQTTADQFFDEDQFEAYRALGYHIGEDLFRQELLGNHSTEGLTLQGWFERLARSLFEEEIQPYRGGRSSGRSSMV